MLTMIMKCFQRYKIFDKTSGSASITHSLYANNSAITFYNYNGQSMWKSSLIYFKLKRTSFSLKTSNMLDLYSR